MDRNSEMAPVADRLLKQVSAAVKNVEADYRKTGKRYNIFKIGKISEREVRMCAILADLLNRKGLHDKGGIYLEFFMEMALPLMENARGIDLARANVFTEYPIDKDRRVDIVIDDGTVFIPIEVKINAGDQENQVADYAAFSRKKNAVTGFVPVLYLTKDGHEPTGAEEGDYVCISFEKHIIPWLQKCLNAGETDKTAPIREVMKQLIRAIKSFCNQTEDEEMENAILEVISQSGENYRAAKLIAEAYNSHDYGTEADEVFKNQILGLVKEKYSSAEYIPVVDDWWCIKIPVKGKYKLVVNYDWRSIAVERVGKTGDAEQNGVRRIMSDATHCSDECLDDYIWLSTTVIYPGLENYGDDEDLYNFELYKIYSKSPQTVAGKIVALAKALESI